MASGELPRRLLTIRALVQPLSQLVTIAIAVAVTSDPGAVVEPSAIPVPDLVTDLIALGLAEACPPGTVAESETITLHLRSTIGIRDSVLPSETDLDLIHDPLRDRLGCIPRCIVTIPAEGGCGRGHGHRHHGTERHHRPPLSHDSSFVEFPTVETPEGSRSRRPSDRIRARTGAARETPTDGARR
jgi:hypothetical protein